MGLRQQVANPEANVHEFIPKMLRGAVSGLYGAALLSEKHAVLFWTELHSRIRQGGRVRRASGEAAPDQRMLLIDRVYALDTAPLEPLVLVLLMQQTTAVEVPVVEPRDLPELLQTLWSAGGSAPTPYHPTSPSPTLNKPYPYPYT